MKLNFDCIRDILLYCEEQSTVDRFICFTNGSFPTELQKYSEDEIKYHLRQLQWDGLITQLTIHSDGMMFSDLTPSGHKFIGEIRSDTNWNKTKSIATQAGVFTINAIKEIAISVATASIQKYLP